MARRMNHLTFILYYYGVPPYGLIIFCLLIEMYNNYNKKCVQKHSRRPRRVLSLNNVRYSN